MGTRLTWLTLAIAATAVPSAAWAQEDMCDRIIEPPPVGSWAEYRTQEGNMRMAVVGSETRDGVEHFWFEMQIAAEQPMIIKMLIPGGLAAFEGVKEVVMKQGSQPAILVPQQTIGMMGQQFTESAGTNLAEECQRSERVGTETITVPMGTVQTTRYRHPEGEAWIADDVPFHLVKTVDKNGREMVLVAAGTDATSAITETPMKMPGM